MIKERKMDKALILIKKNISTIAFAALLILMVTGNLGIVTTAAQSILLKTGIMNANADAVDDTEIFPAVQRIYHSVPAPLDYPDKFLSGYLGAV